MIYRPLDDGAVLSSDGMGWVLAPSLCARRSESMLKLSPFQKGFLGGREMLLLRHPPREDACFCCLTLMSFWKQCNTGALNRVGVSDTLAPGVLAVLIAGPQGVFLVRIVARCGNILSKWWHLCRGRGGVGRSVLCGDREMTVLGTQYEADLWTCPRDALASVFSIDLRMIWDTLMCSLKRDIFTGPGCDCVRYP